MQKSQLNVVRRTEGGTLTSYDGNTTRQEENSIFFLARTQPMKSHGFLVYNSPPNFLFLYIKELPFPCHSGDLQVACHGCKPQIAILCLS